MSESDASSVVSAGESVAGTARGVHDGNGRADQSDLLEHNQDISAAIFGVVYTLSKEKYDRSNKFAVAKIILDFLQLLILIVSPAFGWKIDQNLWLWKAISYLQFKNPLVAKGYTFYIAVLYITIACLVVGLVLCVWVGWCFKNDRFPYIWPIKVLRLVVSIFFVVFYIASLSVFLMALQCNYFSKDKAKRFRMVHFESKCFAFPHMIHAGLAFIATLCFIFVAVVMTIADFELNPLSTSLLASPASVVELRAIVMKTAMCASSALLDGRMKLQAVVIVGAAWLLFWSYLRWMPHYNKWINHVRTSLYGGLSWAALMLLALVFSKKRTEAAFAKQMTDTLFGGLVPALLFSFGLSYVRHALFYNAGIKAFMEPDPKKKLKDIYKFSEVQQVEVLARCCRQWLDEDTLDPEAIKLADHIMKAGMATFGNNAGMVLMLSNFLIEVQNLYQSGHTQLQAAKKMSPSLSQRFVIFIREQEHRQKAQTRSSGESATDLVSYVEFQRNYRTLIRCHKAALFATRDFWKQLLHHDVSFLQLTKAFSSIEGNEARAAKTYKMVLERYPTSAKLLRTYARFLEDVKHDPWGAAKYYSEAEKVEEDADNAQNDAVLDLGGDGEGGALSQVDERNNALMLINASGIIQMANKMAMGIFGYKKGELEGKNVSILMPNPFSQRHNSYLRNYVTSGKAKILNTVREVVGLHKERYVFPLKLAVTKVAGSGSEATFMGVILPEEDNPSVVNCWVMTTGTVLCVDARFTDWFGKGHLDIVGKSITMLAVEQDRISELLEAAAIATEDELNAGLVACKGVSILHKYLDSVLCDVRVNLGGTDGQRLLVMQVSRSDKATAGSNLMVTDQRGQITFVTKGCAQMLGYTTAEMLKLSIANLMNPPFSLMHAKWLAEMPVKVPISSCRNGATVVATTMNGASLPIRLTITPREEGDETTFLITMTKSSFEDGLDLRRLAAQVDQDGRVLTVSASPAALFSFKPAFLAGMDLDSFVDTVRQLVQDDDIKVVTVMHAMIAKVADKPGISWRVGVRPPAALDKTQSDISADPEKSASDTKGAGASSMLAGAQVKAAMMQLEIADACDDQQLHVHLHRADAVTGILEVDREGRICKAGCCALHQPGLIFGCSSASMLRLPLGAFVDLGGLSVAEALLGEGQSKGAMKPGTTTGLKLGPVRKLAGRHTDGDPLTLIVQAVPRDAGRRRIVVKINTVSASKGSAAALRRSIFGEDAAVAGGGGAEGAQQMPFAADGRGAAGALAEVATAQGLQSAEDKGLLAVDSIFGANMMQTQDISRLKAWVLDGAVGDDDPAQQAQRASASNILGQRASTSSVPLVAPTFETAYGTPFGGDDGGSQISADQSHVTGSDSQAAGNEVQTTDYRKGKRFKKLKRLLSGKNTQAAVERFHAHTYGVMMLMLATHLACFIIFTTFIKSLHQYVYEVDAAGRANDMLHRIALNALMFREEHLGKEAPGIYSIADLPHRTMLMQTRIQEFQYNHRGIYLGFTKLRRFKNPLKALWEDANLNASYLVDIERPIVENSTMTLWQLGNQFIMAAREVMANHDRMAGSNSYFGPNTTDLKNNRHWHFVVQNAPAVLFESYKNVLEGLLVRAMDQVQQVNHVNIALLVVEGCGIGIICFVYMWILVKQVINARYQLFSTFLIVPAGFLRVLASKQVHVDEDDNESDSEDEDAGYEANTQANKESAVVATGGKPKAPFLQFQSKLKATALEPSAGVRTGVLGAVRSCSSAVLGFLRGGANSEEASGKRQLRRDARDIFLVLTPFAMWSMLVLIIYSVSYVSLKQRVVAGLIDNSIACTVDFRVTRVIYYALDFCTRDTAAERESVRQMISLSSGRLASSYSALMYGTSVGYVDSRFSSPGTTFTKGAPVSYFFRAKGKCWRHDLSTCFNASSEYYEITHNGIDAMMARLIEDAHLLSEDDDNDVNVSNSRLAYIWKVGNYDLHEGMQSAASQYSSRVLASFQTVLDLHIVLFVLSWSMSCLFLVTIFKPFLRRVQAESRRVAELLSQLPADMDVEALVEQALGCRTGAEPHKRASGKASFDASRAAGKAPADASALGRALSDAGGLDIDGGDDMGKKRRASFNIPASGKGPAAAGDRNNDDASDAASSMNEF